MKIERCCRRYFVSLSLVLLALAGWLCLPDRFSVFRAKSAAAPTAMTFTVTQTGDAGVLCPSPEPTCTLRHAINAANSNPGLDTIRFQIGGSTTVKTINLSSALPAITDPVIIDGTTQPGYAGQPLIELNGTNAGTGANGLTITGGSSTVRGLVINRFNGNGINISNNGGNTIDSNYIGTDATGNAALGNNLYGVRLRSPNNLVGGASPTARNVISGNFVGVAISGTTGENNKVQRNHIGTNAAGSAALGNEDGVLVSEGAINNLIGGPLGAGNVISGNGSTGIEFRDTNTEANRVQSNFIGTDSSGIFAISNNTGVVVNGAPDALIGGDSTGRNLISGNAGFGIFIVSSVPINPMIQGNSIGPSAIGAPLGNGSCGIGITGNGAKISSNTIAFNHNDGICVLSGTGNLILPNLIFSNDRLGIDLGPEGVTPNDAGDVDTGSNNLQNFPILTSAVLSGGNVTVRGTLNSTPNTTLGILVFSSRECDSSGNGEGETPFGSVLGVQSDASGNLSFTLQGPPLSPGRFLTAVAIKYVGPFGFESSEFSPCRQLVSPGSLRFSSASYSVNEGSGTAAITISRTNGSDGVVGCRFTTSNGTALAGQDYGDSDTVLSFASGETSRTIAVPIINDNAPESSETINLNLVDATGGADIGTPDSAVLTINDNDSGTMVQLSSSSYSGSESCAPAIVHVDRIGDISGVSTVDYATTSGTASDRTDFTATTGTLRFEPGEVQKSFTLLVNEDSLVEGTETASITLSHPTGTMLGAPSVATISILDDSLEPATNSIDASTTFVCQHYHDFLNRQADTAGQSFWTSQIESCGTDLQCRELKRINVSAAFFLSIEFQQTGYLVYRMHKAAYGNLPGAPVPLTMLEFLPDTQKIGQGVEVGIGDWQGQLEANKNAYANEFVARNRFAVAYPAGMTPAQFVDALNANSNGALSAAERNQLVNELAAGTKTRAQVLRAVAEDATLVQSELNKAFVLMQYFGYLRRDPNSIPDTDYSGYNFWLNKLNQFGGNFVNAEMVKAFILSGEYRHRFGS